MRNFLLRHIFALQIIAAALLGAVGAAVGLSRRVTVIGLGVIAGLMALWELRMPAPPLSPRQARRLQKRIDQLRSAEPRTRYVSPYVVTFDDHGIVVNIGNKKLESVLWSDLVMVAVTIEDEFLPMPYWLLFGRPGKGGCLYPNDAAGAREMLRELQERLPAFDNVAVIKAMGMMSGGVRVWQHADWKN